MAASPDGSRIYAAGDFTTVNGQARRRVAAFDTATGALMHAFNPTGVNSQARAVIATADTVYVGGGFPGSATASCATTSPPSAPPTARCCRGTRTPTTPCGPSRCRKDGQWVFAGGSFPNVNGLRAYGLAKIDADERHPATPPGSPPSATPDPTPASAA